MNNGGLPSLMQIHQHLALRSLMATGSKQKREGGTILSSPTLLPGKLKLIDANAATERLATVLTASIILSFWHQVLNNVSGAENLQDQSKHSCICFSCDCCKGPVSCCAQHVALNGASTFFTQKPAARSRKIKLNVGLVHLTQCLPYVVLQRLCTLCLPSKVSAVLTEAAVVLPQDEYVKLLNQHVLPGVDDAACRDVVQQAISDFKAKDDVDQMVNFAGHQASLCGQAKELKRSLRQDCHSWVACSWLLPRSAWFSLKARLLTTRQL